MDICLSFRLIYSLKYTIYNMFYCEYIINFRLKIRLFLFLKITLIKSYFIKQLLVYFALQNISTNFDISRKTVLNII